MDLKQTVIIMIGVVSKRGLLPVERQKDINLKLWSMKFLAYIGVIKTLKDFSKC